MHSVYVGECKEHYRSSVSNSPLNYLHSLNLHNLQQAQKKHYIHVRQLVDVFCCVLLRQKHKQQPDIYAQMILAFGTCHLSSHNVTFLRASQPQGNCVCVRTLTWLSKMTVSAFMWPESEVYVCWCLSPHMCVNGYTYIHMRLGNKFTGICIFIKSTLHQGSWSRNLCLYVQVPICASE